MFTFLLLYFIYIHSISNKLYIKNGELYVKEIEFYHNLDDYLKFKKNE